MIIGSFLGCMGSRHTESIWGIDSVINYESLENKITDIEQKLGARVGVSLYDVETKKETWSYKGDSRFPLMSTFKTLACAKVLLDVENKKMSFDSSVLLEKSSLITWSPVTENYVGQDRKSVV